MADDQGGAAYRASEAPSEPQAVEKPAAARPNPRSRLFTLLAGGVAVIAVLVGVWWLLIGSHYVSTDDAYVGADVAQVTPLVAGAVKAVHVADTQPVKAGDVLVEIDPADANLMAAKAEADYQRALRRFRQDVATQGSLSAQIAARDADIGRAKAQVDAARAEADRAKVDMDRRQALAASGAVSGEELTAAKTAYQNAQANLVAAQAAETQAVATRRVAEGQFAAQSAITEGSIDANPDVAAMRAALDSAKLDQQRTLIRAPFDGVITRRQVQVGQRVAVGAQLMTVVPINQLYVDANFKEGQLQKVKIGQPVVLTSDVYGGSIKYHGRVAGLAGGTGSAFALIPAQNATGNWIKVVQRLPVRVRLDPRELADHPLRVGLTMKAEIDIAAPASDNQGG